MKSIFKYSLLALLTVLLLVVCDQAATTDDEGGEVEVAEAVEETPVINAHSLGATILEDYTSALTELNDLLADKPAAEDVLADVTALKEKYVDRFVGYGKARLDFSEADNSKVNLAVRIGLGRVPVEIFTAYSENHKYYFNTDLKDIVVSFNIITQYADFELLKQQAPEEATRLGIE